MFSSAIRSASRVAAVRSTAPVFRTQQALLIRPLATTVRIVIHTHKAYTHVYAL